MKTRKHNLLTLCTSAAALLFSLGVNAMVKPGENAPDFTLKDSAGETRSLSDFEGKTVILEWTNHECPFVQKHYGSGNMQQLQSAYTEDEVVWLSVISSAPGKQGYVSGEEADALTDSRNAKPSFVLLDPSGDTGRAYDAKTTPHMYIIDGEGVLQYAGAIDSIPTANPADIEKATNYVNQAMTELASTAPVSEPLTRPYGCSIKY